MITFDVDEAEMRRLLYIFDMDGTLTYRGPNDPEGSTRFPNEQTLLPGVAETCEALKAEGHILAIASNQGGVAMGMLTEDEAKALVENAARLIGADYYELCPYHPDGLMDAYRKDADCRKPKPGMLLKIMQDAGFGPDETYFIGDRPEDDAAAVNAGVTFVWSADFFR